jgi:thiol:disulfide interchange protein DsbG
MRKLLVIAALSALSVLAGCSDSTPSKSIATQAQVSPVLSFESIQKGTKGFTVGPLTSAKTAYVFFDAQCPHCGELWEATKPFHDKVRFVWIPVAFLNKASLSQGAALIKAADPLKAMNEHEASIKARTGGIAAGLPSDAEKAVLKSNTEFLAGLNVSSVPYLVTTNAISGKVEGLEGSASPEVLAVLFGVTGSIAP